MPITLSSPVSGVSSQPDLTSPTFTVVAIPAAVDGALSYGVSALGGTQTGVSAHSLAKPFTHTAYANMNIRTSDKTGTAVNKTRTMTRKGLVCDALGTIRQGSIEMILRLPAGSEQFDPVSVQSLISCSLGCNSQQGTAIS